MTTSLHVARVPTGWSSTLPPVQSPSARLVGYGTGRISGTGTVDYSVIFATLDDAGFNGPCSIEIEFQGDPFPPLEEINRAMAESYRYIRPFIPRES